MVKLDVRVASKDQFATAIDWALAEGWNPGLDDLDAFFAADDGGFLLGFVDDRPVASISVVKYGERFGFLGFYIVHPDFRGQGLGIQLWNAGMATLDGRTVGLDGVVEQQANYRKSGFSLIGQNVRYAGRVTAQTTPSIGADIRRAAPADVEPVIAYDRLFFADDRSAFVREWVAPTQGARRTCLLAERGGAVVGYGVIRTCQSGRKVGPLFAESAEIASGLFSALAGEQNTEDEVILDVPADNRAAVALAESYGMSPTFETARMYRGTAPDLPLDKTFGITTFELG